MSKNSKHRRTRTARLRAEQAAIGRRLERAVRPNVTGPVLGRANIAYYAAWQIVRGYLA